jgi:chromosome segregation ATPase
MSSEPQESDPGVEDGAGEESPRLTIALPEGCENVSDAIVTNREMLREPGEHGLATDEEITHLSEAIESVSGNVEAVSARCEDQGSEIEEIQATVEQQGQRIEDRDSEIDELRTIVEQQRERIGEQESEVADLRRTVDRQQKQIDELQSTVTQLMEILGTDADWETFES